jgi:hypothetical protein
MLSMNLKTWTEAQGVDYNNHKEKYGALVDAIGLQNLIPLIPATKEQIAKALEDGDEHLNTIPLKNWDDRHAFAKSLAGKVIGQKEGSRISYTWSLAESVCLLKNAAIKWVTQNG